jgi:small subunit ribosomal protein S20
MANHKSALKRIRSNETRRIRNRYHSKTMRNAVRKFRKITDKSEATENLSKIISLIDKLAKKTIIHRNRAANLKSKLSRQVNNL